MTFFSRIPRLAGIGIGLALAASAALAADPPPRMVPDTLGQRLLACTACHGKEGRTTQQGYLPRIAGKPAGYLYHQLVSFRDGRRHNGPMGYLLATTSDAYLHDMADYFAGLDFPYPAPAPTQAARADLDRGQALVLHGDPVRRLPACVQCHHSSMSGVAPAIPGLLGLPSGYLAAQLQAWRTGSRRAVEPDCMAQVARLLTADEIGAVSAWLSVQPVPPGYRPAGSIALPLPLRCGSVAP